MGHVSGKQFVADANQETISRFWRRDQDGHFLKGKITLIRLTKFCLTLSPKIRPLIKKFSHSERLQSDLFHDQWIREVDDKSECLQWSMVQRCRC